MSLFSQIHWLSMVNQINVKNWIYILIARHFWNILCLELYSHTALYNFCRSYENKTTHEINTFHALQQTTNTPNTLVLCFNAPKGITRTGCHQYKYFRTVFTFVFASDTNISHVTTCRHHDTERSQYAVELHEDKGPDSSCFCSDMDSSVSGLTLFLLHFTLPFNK